MIQVMHVISCGELLRNSFEVFLITTSWKKTTHLIFPSVPISKMELSLIDSALKETVLLCRPYVKFIMESCQFYLLYVSQIYSLLITSTTTNRPSHYVWLRLLQKPSIQFILHLATRNKPLRGKVEPAIAHSCPPPTSSPDSVFIYIYIVFFIFKHRAYFIYFFTVSTGMYLQIPKTRHIVDSK